MAKKLSGVCPCGFRFVTPHGEDDTVAVIQYHVKLVHKKEYPKRTHKSPSIGRYKGGHVEAPF
jgi:hypothetical protein